MTTSANAPADGSRTLRTTAVVQTSGPVGASFAVVRRDWKCAVCANNNSGRLRRCARCKEGTQPEESLVWHKGQIANATSSHAWREAVDPESKQIYYHNLETKETTWDRPEVMGPAPLNTGFFGRGKNSGDGQSKYEKNNLEYLKRPAPVQATEGAGNGVTGGAEKGARLEGAGEYNIWFGRFQGQHWSNKKGRGEKAEARCHPSKHAGYTKADDGESFFCLWFAQGVCHRGESCRFIHRIPILADCARLEKDPMHDVFGRDRRTTFRDDMSGVSSLNDPSRTLYVGGLVRGPYEDDEPALQEAVERHFGEWGEVENVNVIWRLAIAFVRYRFRSNAEFALEAMDHQSLDNEECLNVRWAYDDPNPIAKEAAIRANADAVVAAVHSAMASSSSGTTPSDGASSTTTNKRLKQAGEE